MLMSDRGLGASGNQIVGAAGGVLGTSVGAFTPILFGAAAGPLGLAIGGVIAGVAALASAIGVGEGCGQTCIEATNIVNQAEPVFQQNLDAYENGQIDQATAQGNYNTLWENIQVACSKIPGAAGSNCVGDRQEGACKWKQTGQPQYPGQPANGSCWNWYESYYRPLTLPAVNVPVGVASSVSSLFSGSGIDSTTLMIGGAIVVGLMMIGSK